jgi:hypothetical protein
MKDLVVLDVIVSAAWNILEVSLIRDVVTWNSMVLGSVKQGIWKLQNSFLTGC